MTPEEKEKKLAKLQAIYDGAKEGLQSTTDGMAGLFAMCIMKNAYEQMQKLKAMPQETAHEK